MDTCCLLILKELHVFVSQLQIAMLHLYELYIEIINTFARARWNLFMTMMAWYLINDLAFASNKERSRHESISSQIVCGRKNEDIQDS